MFRTYPNHSRSSTEVQRTYRNYVQDVPKLRSEPWWGRKKGIGTTLRTYRNSNEGSFKEDLEEEITPRLSGGNICVEIPLLRRGISKRQGGSPLRRKGNAEWKICCNNTLSFPHNTSPPSIRRLLSYKEGNV